MRARHSSDGFTVETGSYRLRLDERRAVARVDGVDGRPWAQLRLLASVDCLDGPDETLGMAYDYEIDGSAATGDAGDAGDGGDGAGGDAETVVVNVTAQSSRWRERRTVLRCAEREIEVVSAVVGTGRPTAAHLLGGWRPPSGFTPSGSGLRTVVSPNPDHPARLARPAVEPATIGVVGEGGDPGVGRWLFTPAPWCFAVTREPAVSSEEIPSGEWAGLGIAAPLSAQTFTQLHYLPVTDGFSLRLDYEGHTEVDGEFTLPAVLLRFGADDPYQAMDDHREALRERSLIPSPALRTAPSWWRQPIFCGWGAQCDLAATSGGPLQSYATQEHYDEFLDVLARNGIHPGTVTVDDKWQRHYATCRADTDKWPDLAGWIARRHSVGQRVLLWYKAWDAEGAPEDCCVRLPDGRVATLDPGNPDCRALIADAVTHMLSRDGLDADGFKIDFTARTPSGAALRHHGATWGAALLHLLLDTVYTAAKKVKPDALIVTHTPNPAFADVTDMIRLNDVMMLPDAAATPVADHMAYRGRVTQAACPDHLIDTDGWCMPSKAAWRSWLDRQGHVGVPSLYYVSGVDHSGERFTAEDHLAIARSWQDYRSRHDLSEPR
ncbi:MAG: hypothetical protein ACRDTQ_14140 [Micromonosporaceae bacterium]